MANENLVAVEITPEEKTTLDTAVASLIGVLQPKLVSLTTDERVGLTKMGDGSLAFVEKALGYGRSNPEFAPPYMSVDDLEVDVVAVEKLVDIYRPLIQLMKLLDDTIMLSGSEAMMASLSYYASVKTAAKLGVPNAKPIYDDLKKRFAKSKSSTPAPEESGE